MVSPSVKSANEETTDVFLSQPNLIALAQNRETTPFDYVIVGSGAGGGPLAARLALAGKRVLVVEAGQDPKTAPPSPAFPGSFAGEVTRVPGYHGAATEDAEMSWQFSVRHYHDDARQALDTKYNKVLLDPNRPPGSATPLASKYRDPSPPPAGAGKRGILYPRSSGIGGCTGHHAMIMVTPNDEDWNGIADITGDESWRAEKMRAYFARLENCLYPAAYAKFLRRLLGVFYVIWRQVALFFYPRDALDKGGHGFAGWQPTSLIDPALVQSIAKNDRGFINVLIRSSLAVLPGSRLKALLKAVIFRFRSVEALDPNDLNTRRLNPDGGVFLIPLGIASENATKQNSKIKVWIRTTLAVLRRNILFGPLSKQDDKNKNKNGKLEALRERGINPGNRAGVREFLLKTQQEHPDDLVFATGYHVTRVVFEKGGEAPRAIGVEAVEGNHLYEASPLRQSPASKPVCFFSKGEVILCGGAFNTPQLLMLSGIGNKAHLQDNNIRGPRDERGREVAPIVHLPGVGRNLQDRYEVTIVSELNEEFKTLAKISFRPGDPNDLARQEWLDKGTGLYATNGGTIAILQRSTAAAREGHPPDLFTFGAPAAFRGYYWGWSRELLRRTIEAPNDQRNLWSWVILKAYTRNHRGVVRLRSNDPFACPDICFDSFNERAEQVWNRMLAAKERSDATGKPSNAWLESLSRRVEEIRIGSERDLNGVLEAIKKMREVNARNKQFQNEIQPGTNIPDGSPLLKDWVRTQAWGHHASCTCRMGSDPWRKHTTDLQDRFAVLDSQFRVHGVERLRVVDASVFPRIPGYFILTPILMVSEKAADTILRDPLDEVYPASVRAQEIDAIRERRRCALISTAATPSKGGMLPGDTVGLALSGGGIRSATFALGFLQALAEKNRLRKIDFLSTVSGGGFIGSFLGRLFTRSSVTDCADPCGRAQDIIRDSSSAQMWWLRTQANYIFATGPSDLRRNLAIYWRDVFTVHLVMGALLFASFGVLEEVSGHLPPALQPPVYQSFLSAWWWLPLAMFGLVVLPFSLGFWIAPRTGVHRPYPFFALLAGTVLAAGLVYAMTWPEFLRFAFMGSTVLVLGWFFQEAARWRMPKEKKYDAQEENEGSIVRNRLTRGLGEALVLFAFSLGWVLIDSATNFALKKNKWQAVMATLVALSPALPFLRSLAAGATRQLNVSRGKQSSLMTIGTVIGIPLAIFLVFTINLLARLLSQHHHPWLFGTVLIAIAFSLALGPAYTFLNLSSLCATYSARIARTFQGASNDARIYSDDADLQQNIQAAHPDDDVAFEDYHPEKNGGPLHLINICVNETVEEASDRDIRERKGLSMSVGPSGVAVGRRYFAQWAKAEEQPNESLWQRWLDWRAWRRWIDGNHAEYTKEKIALKPVPVGPDPNSFHVLGSTKTPTARVESLTLGKWIGISGAAFTTGLGRSTTLPLAFFMGLINFRLGHWWDTGIKGSERPGRYPANFWRRLKEVPGLIFRMQSLLLAEWRGRFHGASRRFWYLSDGGHFENTGAYELLRRRVPFVIITDAGQDPGTGPDGDGTPPPPGPAETIGSNGNSPAFIWDDVAQLIRQARIDFDAEFEWLDPSSDGQQARAEWTAFLESPDTEWIRAWFDLDALGTLDRVRRRNGRFHAALAKVVYNEKQSVTWLLVVKPSVSADLSEDLLNYSIVNQQFPQDPTVNQFFDDIQWESYRALGQQIGNTLIREPPAHE